MGSFQPPAGSFQSEDIAVLQKVFDDVWSTIVTHRPTQAENDELKTMVSEKICELAASGVLDTDQHRSRTLADFDLSWPPE
jgi:cell shape-determining protein MreC